MPTFTLASKVKTVYGVELPWEERESYDVPAYPDTCPRHSPVPEELKYANPRCTCHPRAKGDLIDQGTVFVPLSTLESVCERTTDDYWSGVTPPTVGHLEGLALEQFDELRAAPESQPGPQQRLRFTMATTGGTVPK
ncbi:hypothetical protein D2E76_16235 [Mycobacteroides abscessus]|uniref:Bacteriophage protein n=1 Tax=Mycobacteroides abscessus TaxID=36809 RepID=A0ABD7HMH2_9MYCO|nr:hypothetical protein [Mycobacteroides abscessus]RIT36800.1 hypothetical protein D2E76_16235 [Mycobacteroides abscessus]